MLIRGAYVIPIDRPPFRGGAVEIDGGRISYVGLASDAPRHNSDVVDYPAAVVLPGFVNAHTHLELSDLAGRVRPGPDLIGWLRDLMGHFAARPPSQAEVEGAFQRGLQQCLSAGVTTVGDITRHPAWTRPLLAKSPLRAVSFGEVIAVGTRRSLLSERLGAAASPQHRSTNLDIGISPHAPYTVEPAGLRACADRADVLSAPVTIHVAESPAEEELTRTATGPFADYLKDLGVWDDEVPASHCSPVELLRRNGLLHRRCLLAHANYVSDADLELIAQSDASVAYCPRTHAAFSHAPHHFRDMLQAGINVCIGTDSLASNPSLSILEELRFLRRRQPDFAPDELLKLGTINGARALHCAAEVGSITAGKRADLVVLPLSEAEVADPCAAVLDSDASPLAVYAAGELVT